jgi:hypothetical protein
MRPAMQIEIDGVSHTFKEWSEITGIKCATLRRRYNHGATPKEFLKLTKSGKGNNK